MIIDPFKDKSMYIDLSYYNKIIAEIETSYLDNTPSHKTSYWFNPENARDLPLSRTSPDNDPAVSAKTHYNLILYVSNYMPVFLINLLYKDRSDVLIEEFGVGSGRFPYYLSKLGFNNFSLWDNWSQCDKALCDLVLKEIAIKSTLNDPNTNPVIVNSSASPFVFITHGFDDRDNEIDTHNLPVNTFNIHKNRDISNVEIVFFYTNRHWENTLAPMMLPQRDFVFLCKDEDDLSVAYCKKDKHSEFIEKIKKYEIKK